MIFNIGVGMKNVTATLESSLPADVTVTSGTEVAFSVVVTDSGVPKEHTFQWYVNDVAVEGATEDTYVRDTSGDKGVFSVWCAVTNKAGTVVSRKANLTVNKLPVLVENYPADASAIIAKTAEFKVTVSEDGYPNEYAYQWYVDEKAVAGATESTYTRTAPAVGTEKIHCVVTNNAGSVQSRVATFTITKEDIVVNGIFADGSTWGTYLSGGAGSITYNSEWGSLRLYVDGARSGYAWSNKQYDFTGKNKLVFYVHAFDDQGYGHNTPIYFGASDTGGDAAFIASTMVYGHHAEYEKVVVDVSAVTGWHYIKFGMTRNIDNADLVYLGSVWFE